MRQKIATKSTQFLGAIYKNPCNTWSVEIVSKAGGENYDKSKIYERVNK